MLTADAPKRHVSELPDPRHRFLARVVDHALGEGWRAAHDFLRFFPPSAIVESMAGADALRVSLLVATTGTHEKIALKKSIPSASEDLDLALAEGTTTPEALLALFPADDKVRLLEPAKLWRLVVEDEFYKVTSAEDAARHGRAAERLTFIIECAIDEGLITLKDVTDGISFDEIAAALPANDLREVVKHALHIARAGTPLTEDRFLAVVPLPTLIARVKLEHTWQNVVIDRVASLAGFVSGRTAVEPAPPSTVAMIVEAPVSVPVAYEAPPPPPAPPEASSPDDDEIRRRVIERLRVIDRLPPNPGDLATPVLLSIESMYADLWAVNDDDEREASIRESFPNDSHLRSAMLALIELLDPSVDTHDPIIRDADVAGLIKIVLFEERRRRDAPAQPRRAQSSSSSGRARRSVPPPLPRSSTPPPFPMDSPRASSPPPLPAEATGGKRDR